MFRSGVKAELGQRVDVVGEAGGVAEAVSVITATRPDVVPKCGAAFLSSGLRARSVHHRKCMDTAGGDSACPLEGTDRNWCEPVDRRPVARLLGRRALYARLAPRKRQLPHLVAGG